MDIIDKILKNVNLKEGRNVIEKFFLNLYFYERLSTRELARMLFIPVPLVTAIKKETIKENLVEQNNGMALSNDGIRYIEDNMGYAGVDKNLYRKILDDNDLSEFYEKVYKTIDFIFQNRVKADVTIDQSKCTSETAINRVLLGLKNYSIIGKKVACIGDDDLISVTINIILNQLIKEETQNTKIYVLEKDKRILEYINNISERYNLKNIVTIETDLKQKINMPADILADCIYTDTPYTYNGLKLFLSRAIEIIKKDTGLNIFLSYGYKAQDDMLKVQLLLSNMGLYISEIFLRFNKYEGAEILGGESQLIILKTTNACKSLAEDKCKELIYTGEIQKTKRKYICRNCKKEYWVGIEEKYRTIECLKESGCEQCKKNVFDLLKREKKDEK